MIDHLERRARQPQRGRAVSATWPTAWRSWSCVNNPLIFSPRRIVLRSGRARLPAITCKPGNSAVAAESSPRCLQIRLVDISMLDRWAADLDRPRHSVSPSGRKSGRLDTPERPVPRSPVFREGLTSGKGAYGRLSGAAAALSAPAGGLDHAGPAILASAATGIVGQIERLSRRRRWHLRQCRHRARNGRHADVAAEARRLHHPVRGSRQAHHPG